MSILPIINEHTANSDIAIVIAAPHSKKNKHYMFRTCDENAKSAAKAIRRYLTDVVPDEHAFVFHLSDDYRSNIDYNRRISRGYNWRVSLNNTIDKLSKEFKYVVLLETHSFPKSYGAFKEDSALVFLNHPNVMGVSEKMQDYFHNLYASGITNLKTELFTGNAMINDVQLSSVYGLDDKKYRSNVYPVLLEFNEDRSLDNDAALDDLAKFLIEFVEDFLPRYAENNDFRAVPFLDLTSKSLVPRASMSGGGPISVINTIIGFMELSMASQLVAVGLIIATLLGALIYQRFWNKKEEFGLMSAKEMAAVGQKSRLALLSSMENTRQTLAAGLKSPYH